MMSAALICVLYYSVNASHPDYATHLKEIDCILQSSIAIREQGADFPLTEEFLKFASILLGFNKGVYLVEGSEECWSVPPESS
jgi:hypothetical protein